MILPVITRQNQSITLSLDCRKQNQSKYKLDKAKKVGETRSDYRKVASNDATLK